MIIIPDIHGRTFWKKAVKGHENDEIVFLGDYNDPYPADNIKPGDYTLKNFEAILNRCLFSLNTLKYLRAYAQLYRPHCPESAMK